jgi:two-component system, sensor histidine kinase and response regulator
MNIFLEKKIDDEGLSSSILKKIESAEKSKSLFLNLLSHQLRTPLNGIIGNLSLINLDKLDIEEKEIFKQIKFSSEQLQSIIDSTMDFSLILSNEIQIQKAPFNFIRLMENLKTFFELKLNEKKLELKIQFENENGKHFLGDQKRVSQILKNILDNSIKFSNLNSNIEISFKFESISNHQEKIFISISDSGIGITESEKTKLFQSFNLSNSRDQGIGIGLAVARSLAKIMDGEIYIDSEKNQGTKVSIELNLERIDLGKPIPIQTFSNPISDDQKLADVIPLHILVAEDNMINQTLILNMLKKLGYISLLAKNGRECVEIYHENKDINLILMDLAMPEMDGIEASKLILTENSKPPVIIAMTANILDMEKENCIEIGMKDFIQKPFKIDMLVETIEKWFKN